jgi:hypothetical protein
VTYIRHCVRNWQLLSYCSWRVIRCPISEEGVHTHTHTHIYIYVYTYAT